MTAEESAIALRDRLGLPKGMISIWLQRSLAIIKDRKIIRKASVKICVAINPKHKKKVILPKQISGFIVEKQKVPWQPVEGEQLAVAEKHMMAKGKENG